jgi:hypothetical protein
MNGRSHWRSGRRIAAALCVAASLGLFAGQARAAAPTNCGQADATTAVAFVGLSEANITLTAQPDGSFAGPVTIRVYCVSASGADIGEVLGSQVTVTTNVPNTKFDGQAASGGSTATIDLPLGTKTMTVVSTDPGLAPGVSFARVGTDITTATMIFSASAGGSGPAGTTTIFARTPELSSIALLASGGVGAFGYFLIAARSKRRRS